MKYYNHLIETIGNTPLVKLNHVTQGIKGTLLGKMEYMNPGHSMKDRIGLKMIEDAERDGLLKPGGTIIEGTSGNTGMGLALVAKAKGYRCIFTMADKQSQEKIDALKALGAEVIVCPTNVPAEDPRSYYSVAKKMNEEIPNSFYPNQYDNPSNALAHYESTGPEIWRDTEGKITHLVAGVGTGGSICGTTKYLKEQSPDLITIGIDSYGSVFKKYKETGIFDEKEIYPYLTEGIGEDILPENVDFDLIDKFIKVTDKDGAIMTRRLAREEGMFLGWSCGSAVYGALEYARNNLKEDDVMVIILPDHGTRYLGKLYNDGWMKNHGFFEKRDFATARDIIKDRKKPLSVVKNTDTVGDVVKLLSERGIDQVPIVDGEKFIGSITVTKILSGIMENPEIKGVSIAEIMDPPLPFVALDNTLDVLSSMLDQSHKALLVSDEGHQVHIITHHDVLNAMTR
ncbi:MAG: pyridoxal-phosphate dependent enzyme [Cyclobacteriaceae bacterium]|nr:pyridoxal-phosphate dependent enzyme [Cyclobacteriaceae bacterium]